MKYVRQFLGMVISSSILLAFLAAGLWLWSQCGGESLHLLASLAFLIVWASLWTQILFALTTFFVEREWFT